MLFFFVLSIILLCLPPWKPTALNKLIKNQPVHGNKIVFKSGPRTNIKCKIFSVIHVRLSSSLGIGKSAETGTLAPTQSFWFLHP